MLEDPSGNALPCHVEYPLPLPAIYYPSEFLEALYPILTCLAIKDLYVRVSPTSAKPEFLRSYATRSN